MKRFYIFAAIFLVTGGALSVYAQDLILVRDGSIIEARIAEISPTEIRYRRFDNQSGPIIIIPAAEVITIRYENGRVEIINPATGRLGDTRMDPDRWIFGIVADPVGLMFAGAAITLELTKGGFYSFVNLRFPPLGGEGGGFGFGLALHYLHHTRSGGFYIGAFGELTPNAGEKEFEDVYWNGYDWVSITGTEYVVGFAFALSTGYKLVLRSGITFIPSVYVGYEYNGEGSFMFRPALAFGYSF